MTTGSHEHRPGECIDGRYLLIRPLDGGGMGAVWVAHHLPLDVHVAIKFIRPEADGPDASSRLTLEAQSAARVHHPAIVRILDVGRAADGAAYLVMELLEGECLADVLAREGRLPSVTAVRVLLPIVHAIDALHRRDILHRDVKPDNIFLSRDDTGHWRPKLIDFGLARSMSPDRRRITQRGAIIGTLAYMSRERLLGEDVDLGEDIWSLSVVLYEMITGQLPYEGETPRELIAALTSNDPRPIVDENDPDGELWAIVRRGLRPRGERWETAAALGEALDAWLGRRGELGDTTRVSRMLAVRDRDDARDEADASTSRSATLPYELRRRAATTATAEAARPMVTPSGDGDAVCTVVRTRSTSHRRPVRRDAALGLAAATIACVVSAAWLWSAGHDHGESAAGATAAVEPAVGPSSDDRVSYPPPPDPPPSVGSGSPDEGVPVDSPPLEDVRVARAPVAAPPAGRHAPPVNAGVAAASTSSARTPAPPKTAVRLPRRTPAPPPPPQPTAPNTIEIKNPYL